MNYDLEQIQEILESAARLDRVQRAQFLQLRCGDDVEARREVESLLASVEQSTGFLDHQVGPIGSGYGESPGDKVDDYELLQVIGEGGFGVVWQARQLHPIVREAALKIVKPGMDTPQVLARFQAEQRTLAKLEHPGIARVYDAGATPRGRPYFVMELVRGSELTRYCDEHRAPVRMRVSLLAEVCDAVHHAHQRGVIHRDLKPSNVLVSDVEGVPRPKVIDFGVAKAINAPLAEQLTVTRSGQRVGTPPYMSPEQFGSDREIDTRSDIYALGVLLYESLTGSTPLRFEKEQHPVIEEIARRVRSDDPPTPVARLSMIGDRLEEIASARAADIGELRRAVRGELTWIVRRCLEINPERRYPTVAHLAEDMRRYLAGMPVDAGPAGIGYRARKFLRRHRKRAVLVAMLFVTVVSIAWGWWMRREYGPESPAAVRDAITRGYALLHAGKPAEAEAVLRDSVHRAERIYPPGDPGLVESVTALTMCLNDENKIEEALAQDHRLLEICRMGKLTPFHAADLSDWYGGKLFWMGRYPEAAVALEESIIIQERAGTTFRMTDKYRFTLSRLAQCFDHLHRPDDAAHWRARLATAEAATRPQ